MQYVYTFMSVAYLVVALAIAFLDYQPDKFTLGVAFLLVAGYMAIDAITYDKGAN
jgi:hypothetical protein